MTDAPTSGTAVTASGTSVNFNGIPSTAKRVTVMFSGVSTNGASGLKAQIGDSGGIENTGYLAAGGIGQQSQAWVVTSLTDAFSVVSANAAWSATASFHGKLSLEKLDGNTWVANGIFYNSTATVQLYISSGAKTLSDTLTQIRITTVNGTDTFDAGTINILVE